MDAAGEDNDVKVYRASAELLPELQAKLPQLLWQQRDGFKNLRVRVIYRKTEDLVTLLEVFQEWPQLLDGHLASLLQILCDAFLTYVTTRAQNYFEDQAYHKHPAKVTIPLPRAACRLLYIFCKVRGQKVVVRFFNNEPRYIEPILTCLRKWASPDHLESVDPHHVMTWEERYIMLLWLSHLMLAPFDLASISSSNIDSSSSKLSAVTQGLPSIARTLLETAFEYLHVPGKEREAASGLVVRLGLRGDMQAKQLLPRVVNHAVAGLMQGDLTGVSATASAYRYGGLLSLLCGIMTVGSDHDVAPYVTGIFRVGIRLATQEGVHETQVRNTAPVRKLLIKAIRLCVLHALSLTKTPLPATATYDLDAMLEETIQYLLDSLHDKDTPVRMVASKSLSLITTSLDPDMSAEVTQAVLQSLDDNMLLEDSMGRTFAYTEISTSNVRDFNKNTSAVNPLRWHGLMLTLGHLLFRRSLPPQQLPEIITALIAGLDFEQRSNVGTSVGVGVRDAACFGIWSLARKYNTSEINGTNLSQLLKVLDKAGDVVAANYSTSQVLASQLVLSACFDPSGNMRRGSSAALQELIGRHPDTILHGIPLVQAVDYHAVARRSRAMREVSYQAAILDKVYLDSLLKALLSWKGLRSPDADSHRWAAQAVPGLVGLLPLDSAIHHCEQLAAQTAKLKPTNAGSNAGIRHGLLLGLSAMLVKTRSMRDVISRSKPEDPAAITAFKNMHQYVFNNLEILTGKLSGRVTRDLELVFEATSVLVGALAKISATTDTSNDARLLSVLERCLIGSERESVVLESTQAFMVLFRRLDAPTQAGLLQRWLHSSQSELVEYRCKGRLEAIASIFWWIPMNGPDVTMSQALDYLEQFIRDQWPIDTKIKAMGSLETVLLAGYNSHTNRMQLYRLSSQMTSVASVILTGLNDYTIDQRGDIGSTLRLKSIDTAGAYMESCSVSAQPIIQAIARLAAEKLDKLRLQAWLLLQAFWKQQSDFPPLKKEFSHLADVSLAEYYLQLFELLDVEWLQKCIIAGVVSSAAAGTEDLGRASRSALTIHMLHEDTRRQKPGLAYILDCLIDHLEQVVADDREAIPAIETLAFILEQQLASATAASAKVLRIMQRAHTPTSSIHRLEAATKVYSALCNTDQRMVALDKLTRLLLHRYPKIRGDAADTLHLHTSESGLLMYDWTLPVVELKSMVVHLRKQLKVV